MALTEDRLLHGTYELCAEGNLNRHDVAALMSDFLGRPIEVSTINRSANTDMPPKLRNMMAWYDRHSLLSNAMTLRAILGREPRTLGAFLEELNARPEKKS
jgi:hypothetical protein